MTRSLEALCEAAEIQSGTNPADAVDGAVDNANVTANPSPNPIANADTTATGTTEDDTQPQIQPPVVKNEDVVVEEQVMADPAALAVAAAAPVAPANPIAPPSDPVAPPAEVAVTEMAAEPDATATTDIAAAIASDPGMQVTYTVNPVVNEAAANPVVNADVNMNAAVNPVMTEAEAAAIPTMVAAPNPVETVADAIMAVTATHPDVTMTATAADPVMIVIPADPITFVNAPPVEQTTFVTTTTTEPPAQPVPALNPVMNAATIPVYVTANPVVTATPPILNNFVPSVPAPVPVAAPATIGFGMDVKMEDVKMEDMHNQVVDDTVPSLPALHVPGADGSTNVNGNMNVNGNVNVKVHDVAVPSEVVERAQQEAIAAAVVHTAPPLTIPIPPQPVKPARKRGWVKKTWEERLEELKAYKALNGDCNVPTICKSNPSLGHWVHDQRKQYRLYQNNKQTSMNPLRIAQLEEVGFKWALQRHTTMRSWAERFGQLEDFKRANGHCNVPIRFKVNPSLGQWVSTQRQEYSNYRNGKKSNMTKDRITKLEAAEFCWSLRDTAKMAPRKSWDMHFAALTEFRKDNGHCDVRVRSKQNPTGSLGRWVEKQRSQYHSRNEGKESKLTQEQVDKLDSIGFKWRIRHERNKISGCARNPELKLNEMALLDDYTKRSLDESAKQAQAQAHAQAQIQAQAQVQAIQAQAQAQAQAQQAGAEAQQMIAQQMAMAVHMSPEPMKIEPTEMETSVVAAIDPVAIEAAAVAAVESIPVEQEPQVESFAIHVPLPIPATLDETMTHEV